MKNEVMGLFVTFVVLVGWSTAALQWLHERGCPKDVTVQEICRVAGDEGEVRGMLDAVWEEPKRAEEIYYACFGFHLGSDYLFYSLALSMRFACFYLFCCQEACRKSTK